MKKLALITSVVMLGAMTALAGTISVPAFNDGGDNTNAQLFPSNGLQATFIALKNNEATTNTYTVLYFFNTGVDRTPAANTFTIAGNAARGWRPVADDPNEGVGQAIPNATGTAGAGSATILYSELTPPSGRVLINVGTVNSSYSFALVP